MMEQQQDLGGLSPTN